VVAFAADRRHVQGHAVVSGAGRRGRHGRSSRARSCCAPRPPRRLGEHYKWVRQQLALRPEQRQPAAGASTRSGGGSGSRAARAGARASPGPGGGGRPAGDAPDAAEASLWRGVGLVVDQMDGLVSGYNARVSELGPGAGIDFMTPAEFLTLNSIGGRRPAGRAAAAGAAHARAPPPAPPPRRRGAPPSPSPVAGLHQTGWPPLLRCPR
jgi:hypothetical protein